MRRQSIEGTLVCYAATLDRTLLESTEKLEQLRALEHGINIGITIVDDYQSLSVDTEQDLAKARRVFRG